MSSLTSSAGSVKLAARKDTGLLCVTKFVCKTKVLPEAWVPSPRRDDRSTPIEIHLLETLNHPNIVSVLDIYENPMFYQIVMEKLGTGCDLFEVGDGDLMHMMMIVFHLSSSNVILRLTSR